MRSQNPECPGYTATRSGTQSLSASPFRQILFRGAEWFYGGGVDGVAVG